MPSSLTCPEEAELLAVALGEGPSDELRIHLSGCSLCRERLGQLNLEVAMFRDHGQVDESFPSTVNETAPGADIANGQASDPAASAAPSEA